MHGRPGVGGRRTAVRTRTRVLSRRSTAVTATALAAVTALLAAPVAVARPVAAPALPAVDVSPVSVIVRETVTAGRAPEAAVRAFGGTIDRRLGLIQGFSATVPADAVPALHRSAGVRSVTTDAPLQLSSALDDMAEYAAAPGSMAAVAQRQTGAAELWEAGVTGRGVDVALIDSGVVPVDGLSGPDKVVHGPDLSLEGDDCSSGDCVATPARHLDSYGHGTHMAGIIAGRDDDAPARRWPAATAATSLGMAPDARLVSVKVADESGATDVSQVIAAIDWVVRHRNSDGLDIRVLNLSFGTDGVQDYQLDPLSYAAEVAWHARHRRRRRRRQQRLRQREAQQPGVQPVRDRGRRLGRPRHRRPWPTTSSPTGRARATARATPTSSRRASRW